MLCMQDYRENQGNIRTSQDGGAWFKDPASYEHFYDTEHRKVRPLNECCTVSPPSIHMHNKSVANLHVQSLKEQHQVRVYLHSDEP